MPLQWLKRIAAPRTGAGRPITPAAAALAEVLAKSATLPLPDPAPPGSLPGPDRSRPAVEVPADKISQRAYEKWVARGRPEGAPERDWFEAEAELRAEYESGCAEPLPRKSR